MSYYVDEIGGSGIQEITINSYPYRVSASIACWYSGSGSGGHDTASLTLYENGMEVWSQTDSNVGDSYNLYNQPLYQIVLDAGTAANFNIIRHHSEGASEGSWALVAHVIRTIW